MLFIFLSCNYLCFSLLNLSRLRQSLNHITWKCFPRLITIVFVHAPWMNEWMCASLIHYTCVTDRCFMGWIIVCLFLNLIDPYLLQSLTRFKPLEDFFRQFFFAFFLMTHCIFLLFIHENKQSSSCIDINKSRKSSFQTINDQNTSITGKWSLNWLITSALVL